MGCATTCTGYELLNDIDLSDRDWTPIGGGVRSPRLGGSIFNYEPPSSVRYNAVFEGNGHVLRGLRVNGLGARWHFVGLFSALGAAGVIRNVGLVDVDVSAGFGRIAFEGDRSGWMGALAGMNYGKVAASYAVGGTVHGDWCVGGLVGGNRGTIIASYANVTVESHGSETLSTLNSGGLAFNNAGDSRIIASYSLSRNEGRGGGLVAYNNLATAGVAAIGNSYYAGDRGSWHAGFAVPASVAQTSGQVARPDHGRGNIRGLVRFERGRHDGHGHGRRDARRRRSMGFRERY